MTPPRSEQVALLDFDRKQIKALSSVACSDVFSTMSSLRAKSKRELALELGKSPASVGPHVDTLVQVGLAIEVGARKRRSRTETLYLTKAHTFRANMVGQNKATLQQYQKRIRGQMRLYERQIIAFQDVVHDDPSQQLYITHNWRSAYLSPENALRVKEAIQNLVDLVANFAEDDEDAIENHNVVRMTVAAIMAPTLSESKRLAK